MDAIAFRLGAIEVHWYGILIAMAFFIGIVGSSFKVRQAGLDEDKYINLIIILIISSILGARLYYVAFEWSYYYAHPADILAIWKGGLAIHGGILAGTLALLYGCKYYQFKFWQVADMITPFLILGQSIGRWGNYFNQEAYGYVVDRLDIPWAMYIDGAWRHPTFLYESIWDFCGFLLLLTYDKYKKNMDGDTSLIYLMYYSVGRFVIESFRTDSLMLGPLRMAQVISIVFFLVAFGLFMFRRKDRIG